MKKALKNESIQALVSALLCILLGLLIGFIVLLFINPSGAGESILNIIKNFFTWSRPASRMKQLGNTLAKSMPLILCSLSILFSYKAKTFSPIFLHFEHYNFQFCAEYIRCNIYNNFFSKFPRF